MVAISAARSPHEDCLAEDVFVDDVRRSAKLKESRKDNKKQSSGAKAWAWRKQGDSRSQGSAPELERHNKGDMGRPNHTC